MADDAPPALPPREAAAPPELPPREAVEALSIEEDVAAAEGYEDEEADAAEALPEAPPPLTEEEEEARGVAQHLLLNAPPGEFTELLDDVPEAPPGRGCHNMATAMFVQWLGYGIFSARHGPHVAPEEHAVWFTQRKVAANIFTRRNFRSLMRDVFVSKARELIEIVEQGARGVSPRHRDRYLRQLRRRHSGGRQGAAATAACRGCVGAGEARLSRTRYSYQLACW